MVTKIQSNVPSNHVGDLNRIGSKTEVSRLATSTIGKTSDLVSLSDEARILQRATQAASQSRVVRDDVVQSIQSQLKTGSYMIDAEDIAGKLLSILR